MPPKKPAKEEAPEEVGEVRVVGPGETPRMQGCLGRSADGTRGKLCGGYRGALVHCLQAPPRSAHGVGPAACGLPADEARLQGSWMTMANRDRRMCSSW